MQTPVPETINDLTTKQKKELNEIAKKIINPNYKINKNNNDELKKLKIQNKRLIDDIKKARPFNPILHHDGLDVSWLMRQYIILTSKNNNVMIFMELRSGKKDFFIIDASQKDFQYNKKRYIIDDAAKYYINSLKMYAYDYHEDISIPVIHNTPAAQIRNQIKKSDLECTTLVNPEIIDEYVIAKIAQNVIAAGAKLHEYLKTILIITAVTLAAVLIFFLVFVIKTGMLNQVTGALHL